MVLLVKLAGVALVIAAAKRLQQQDICAKATTAVADVTGKPRIFAITNMAIAQTSIDPGRIVHGTTCVSAVLTQTTSNGITTAEAV